jgi:phenylacetate-coenzyme A ligase PaaK-like adenylate-forming protein
MTGMVRRIRAFRIARRVAEQHEFYAHRGDLSSSLAWQRDRFNDQWRFLRANVPYWRTVANERRLPDRFASWEEFSALVPSVSRAQVRLAGAAMVDPRESPHQLRSTGGSTGEPLRFPVWKSEAVVASDDLWFARSWFDISGSDKLFLIWGHSHLLGHGIGGWLSARRRQLKDRLLGYHRTSAYHLDDDSLCDACQALLRFRPTYVLGYAAALDRFGRANAHRRDELRALGLKAVVATAESFPCSDSRELLAESFGCPVVMEYGSVETGPLAHERQGGDYQVLWRRWFVEAVPFDGVPPFRQILVTSLYPRCLPLVRYALGDLIEPADEGSTVARAFRSVVGRCNDVVRLPGGQVVHSEAFTHAVKESAMGAFQVGETAEGVRLRYTASRPLSERELAEVRRRLTTISPSLESLAIDRVDSLEMTTAGKTRRVSRER